jgi:hypothetical protein
MKNLYDEDGNILLQDLLIRSKVRKTQRKNTSLKITRPGA